MNNCPICFQENINNTILCETNCNHLFCSACLNRWFDRNRFDCPTCRTIINSFVCNNVINRLIIINNQNINQNINPNMNQNNLLKYIKIQKVFMFLFLSILLIYVYLYHQLDDDYADCLINNTLLTNNLVKINIIYNNIHKQCFIPFKYINNC